MTAPESKTVLATPPLSPPAGPPGARITIRAFVLGILIAAVFAALSVYLNNRKYLDMSSTQIPVLPYLFLLATVLAVNPLCRLIRIVRPFTVAEILTVFTMGVVSAGISVYGLSAQLVPVMSNLFNPSWNRDQTEWNRYVEPMLNEAFFVSEPGIRAAAIPVQEAIDTMERSRSLYDAALARQKAQQGATPERLAVAQSRWELHAAADPELLALPPEHALGACARRLDADAARLTERRKVLRDLEQRAFAKVERFRRGLPPGQRAFPGIFPLGDDTFGSYAARLHRLVEGTRALKEVKAAYGLSSPEEAARHLDAAIAILNRVTDTAAVSAEHAAWQRRIDDTRARQVAVETALAQLHGQSRLADAAGQRALRPQIRQLERERRRQDADQEAAADSMAGAQRELDVRQRAASIAATLAEIRRRLPEAAALGTATTAVRDQLAAVMKDFPGIDASLRRYFLGDIPWAVWISPLLRWGMLIALTYIVLLAFNVLIFRQWAYNEKLSYPLVQLSETLAGVDGAGDGVPPVFRSGLFWIGAVISGGVLGWNLLCATQLVPGLETMDLTHDWGSFIRNTPLQGLLPGARSSIFFTMIGLSFLVPQKISFSLWAFSVLYMVQLLVLVGFGYGVNEDSFPVDWWYTMNFRTAEGGGALLVFSLVVLYKCRKYILCFFSPASISMLERDERAELRTASFLFLFGSAAIVGVQWYALHINPVYAVFFWLIVLLITIGLVRAVTEGGILGFQAWANPFHFIRTLFGMDKGWTAPHLFAPVMVYYAVFFHDLKTFIAPAMANSLKIRDDLRLKRVGFHAALLSAIAVAVFVAVFTEIMMGYSRGADNMERWFHSSFPQGLFDQLTALSKAPPAGGGPERAWMITGAVAMSALLYFRQTRFWLPHPIGFIMLVNPIMHTYWFSIFVGWLAKSLVTRYGNKDVYAKVRGLFIGLIAGEIAVVVLAAVLSVALSVNIPITLNRN